MKPDTNADFYNDPEGLAVRLLEEARDYAKEQESFDQNDFGGFYDYLNGLISARLVVIGRLGYDRYIKDYLPDWTDC